MDNNKSFWQRVSKLYNWGVSAAGNGLFPTLAERICADWQGSERVLELACGSGQLTLLMPPRCATLTATDFAPNMVAEAKKRAGSNYPNLSFGVEDATALTFADGTFDCVVISNALHIMPEPGKALAEIRRVLRTGGKLYAPTFVYQTDRRYLFPRLFALAGFKVYHRRTEAQLLSLIEEAGFEIARHEVLPSGISEVAYIAGKKK